MLEKVDLTKKISKEQYREQMPLLESRMAQLQRQCRTLNIPIMIAFEGVGASGKGMQIGKLIHSLDPRGFQVFTVKAETIEEIRRPFLWRFWTKLPEKGGISIYDGSWYRRVLIERCDKLVKGKQVTEAYHSICSFEKQITDDGYVLIKLLLAIDKKEQEKRLNKLSAYKETAWRVTKSDLQRNKDFKKYAKMTEDMLQKTDTEYAPWTIIEAIDRRFATLKIYTTIIRALEDHVENHLAAKANEKNVQSDMEADLYMHSENTCTECFNTPLLGDSLLSKIKLSKTISQNEYKKKIKKLQKELALLHSELYRKGIPVILGFEGWDAGGKGGAIKRLTEKMDARGYVVNPTASPNDFERAHHYLWRFWKAVPKTGHISIFDRTWYGRVMVERIEGFCTKEEWQRAYREINDMEKDFTDAGIIVLKFWMQIDKEEQERRFKERQANPEKQWKITDEDWRNREKWEQYEIAVNEMLLRTSTEYAPWIVVEGNDKYYARIKVLETVVTTIKQKIAMQEKRKYTKETEYN